MSALLQKLYDYNAWANADLFDKLTTLEQAEPNAELHAVLRLMNHYYVVGRIFAAHLTGTPHGYTSDNMEETLALAVLRSAIRSSDQWFIDYINGNSFERLQESLSFTFTDGDKGYMTREEMLLHVALHGGYHRGEIGRILWQLSITPPWDTLAVYLHQAEPDRRRQGDMLSVSA